MNALDSMYLSCQFALRNEVTERNSCIEEARADFKENKDRNAEYCYHARCALINKRYKPVINELTAKMAQIINSSIGETGVIYQHPIPDTFDFDGMMRRVLG